MGRDALARDPRASRGQNHDVEVMASGRAVDFLAKRFDGVNRIHGFHMIYEGEPRPADEDALVERDHRRDRRRRTSPRTSSSSGASSRTPSSATSSRGRTLYRLTHRLPILRIDNMQIINRTTLPAAIVEGHQAEFQLTKPSSDRSCRGATSTSSPRSSIRRSGRKRRNALPAPSCGPEIIEAKKTASRGEQHLLICHHDGEGNEKMAETLKATGIECRIYGMRRGLEKEVVEGNMRCTSRSARTSSSTTSPMSRAVIAGGGFTPWAGRSISHKPMLAAARRQFEQTLNARYLELEGFGRRGRSPTIRRSDFTTSSPRSPAAEKLA